MVLVANIIVDSGGANQLTIWTSSVKKSLRKKLTIIKIPKSSAKWGDGPLVKILDLLMIEERFVITGFIDSTDATKFDNIVTKGGTISMVFNSITYTVNVDGNDLNYDGSMENDEIPIQLTCVKGVNV